MLNNHLSDNKGNENKAKAKKRKEGVSNYHDLKDEAEKPIKNRKKLPIGRNGNEITVRKHHFTQEELDTKIQDAQQNNGICNPCKRLGLWWAQIEALIQMGADEFHIERDVFLRIRQILSNLPPRQKDAGFDTAWDVVLTRQNKTSKKPKDIRSRIQDNYRVLQRIVKANNTDKNPYGEKLRQLRLCIDIEHRSPEGITTPTLSVPYYRLNTAHNTVESTLPSYVNSISKRGRKPKLRSSEQSEQVKIKNVTEDISQVPVISLINNNTDELIDSSDGNIIDPFNIKNY